MKYKNVVLTQRGGPDVLKIQENSLRPPKTNEVQVKVLSCGVGRPDIAMRRGYYPYAPKLPFVPGYEIVGEVTSAGPGVKKFKKGDLVAALTVYGGYSEYIFIDEEDLVNVPKEVKPDEAVALILNYCTAYQILHRVLKVKKGQKVLITGASGGVGSALIDLGGLVGLKMYGTASTGKLDALNKQGVVPLDYKSKNWIKDLKEMEPQGLDYVIDGVGEKYIKIGFSVLKKGGKLVEFAFPSITKMLAGLIKIKWFSFLPNGKKGEFYGISENYKKEKESIHEDMMILFELLKQEKIKPLIAKRFSILEAADANELLESGSITGKIVLVAQNAD